MQTPMTVAVCCLSAVLLAACQKERPEPPKPKVEAVQIETGSASPSSTQTSVPAADTVFPAAGVAAPASTPSVRTNKAMTRAEESAAMPMAGQANDHSAPAAVAASRPSGR